MLGKINLYLVFDWFFIFFKKSLKLISKSDKNSKWLIYQQEEKFYIFYEKRRGRSIVFGVDCFRSIDVRV